MILKSFLREHERRERVFISRSPCFCVYRTENLKIFTEQSRARPRNCRRHVITSTRRSTNGRALTRAFSSARPPTHSRVNKAPRGWKGARTTGASPVTCLFNCVCVPGIEGSSPRVVVVATHGWDLISTNFLESSATEGPLRSRAEGEEQMGKSWLPSGWREVQHQRSIVHIWFYINCFLLHTRI